MNISSRADKIPAWLKVAATIGCCIAFSYIAIKAIVGIIGLIIAAALCLFSLKLGPVLAEFLDNLRVKLIVKQAIDSPIPTLINQSQRYHAEKDAKKLKLEEILGKFETVKGKHEAYATKYPQDLTEIEKNDKYRSRAAASVERKKQDFKTLTNNVIAFDKEIEKAADKWDVAMTMRDFDLAGDFNNDPMELIRSRTALSSVEDAVNKSFAQLEVSLLEDLSVETNHVIDITPKASERIRLK